MQYYAFPALQLLFALALAWLDGGHLVRAQPPHFLAHRNLTNSTAVITASQLRQAGINSQIAANIITALEFERSNWANGSVEDDDFYRVPSGTANAPPGTLLKLQIKANTSAYTLPPNTALSRFLFQTQDLNGSAIPASGFVLWPYFPRVQPDGGYPVVGWGHGTSGGFANCAPSHIRNLWYQFAGPFTLALQGYVVVAPDYAGLGVDQDANGRPIVHQYLANPSHANDLFYSIQAAQSAFEVLSKQFVIVGHSQGGGAAWGAAQRQALRPVEGYLGSVAGSPVTSFLSAVPPGKVTIPTVIGEATLVIRAAASVFPEFDRSEVLTSSGIKRLNLLSQIQGCNSVVEKLFVGPDDFLQANAVENPSLQSFQALTGNGGRPISGPLLVLHGTADTTVPYLVTDIVVNRTCELFPQSQLEFASFANVTHVPVMYASQRIWLQWIEDRFAGVPLPSACHRSSYASARAYEEYQRDGNWYIKLAAQPYEVA